MKSGKRTARRSVYSGEYLSRTDSSTFQQSTMADVDSSHVFTCISCAVAFNDPALQRQHFASDWHRYNMKVSSGVPLPFLLEWLLIRNFVCVEACGIASSR